MRIGISGFFLNKPTTGSGQYTLNLLRELREVAGDELVVFCPSKETCRVAESLVESSSGANVHIVSVGKFLRHNVDKLWFEQIALPLACRRHKVDLLHVPYFAPPLQNSTKLVVTVHDLIMMILPQHKGSAFVRWYTALARAGAKRANLLLADSQHTKADSARLLSVSPERIEVIYLACEKRFLPVTDEDRLNKVRQRHKLNSDFIFYIGGLDWRKNIATLIHAFSKVGGNLDLVIAGESPSKHPTLYPDLREVAKTVGINRRVKFLGLVAEEDKPVLYSLARLFVFPSLYEGFGLTPLEAMACGTPVLCSDAASLPEVVGDGGVLFNPKDCNALTRLIRETLTSENRLLEMRECGLKRARNFSWRLTAEKTLAAYKAILA